MSLREELASIPGVVDADIDLRDGQPTAIRIHSGEGADQRFIGEAVQHALRRHGLRSRVAPPRRAPEPPTAPAPPNLAVLPDLGAPELGSAPARAVQPNPKLTTVDVRDDGQRALVVVIDDQGGVAEARGGRDQQGQIAACVRAVARLLDPSADPPDLVSARRWEHEEQRFITVILEVDGQTRVGSAVNDGLELRSVAMATWQALSA